MPSLEMRVQAANGVCRRRVPILLELSLIHATLEFAGFRDGLLSGIQCLSDRRCYHQRSVLQSVSCPKNVLTIRPQFSLCHNHTLTRVLAQDNFVGNENL